MVASARPSLAALCESRAGHDVDQWTAEDVVCGVVDAGGM